MKIFGIGMNYVAHTKELQPMMILQPEEPVVFTKADSSLLPSGRPFFIPSYTQQCEYEVELVVKINHLGRHISERFAHRYYDEVTVGIDFTARDLQTQLRAKGLPWDLCKGFDGSTVIGSFVPKTRFVSVQQLSFRLDANGTTVQVGNTADMIHTIDYLISYVSQFFTLKTGDLLFTGTPAGVGPVHIGDHLEGFLEGEKLLNLHVK